MKKKVCIEYSSESTPDNEMNRHDGVTREEKSLHWVHFDVNEIPRDIKPGRLEGLLCAPSTRVSTTFALTTST
ncbi:hypothetical protein ACHHYP_20294 [Achlya hypogyna]|uniref:Uncharacterized protein n=1 Tax=Achlya hypogyna TaxID=1202772 RepID=A0A1V9YT30_ACHHY|nr:hypothetical protein ACHHYP_20294 [Achlya hypogyna]